MMTGMSSTLRPITVITTLCVSLLLAGCITINVESPEPSAPTSSKPTHVAETVDDTAALSQLGAAMGALFSYVERQDDEDCEYVQYVSGSMTNATPLDEYRGTYEQIQKSMDLIGSSCFHDPHDPDAVNLAVQTRKLVTSILDDRNYLGASDWSKGQPEPGGQRD